MPSKGRKVPPPLPRRGPPLVWKRIERAGQEMIVALVEGSDLERELRRTQWVQAHPEGEAYARMLFRKREGSAVSFIAYGDNIMAGGLDGTFTTPEKRRFVPGEPNKCHDNCAELNREHPEYRRGVGHAFHDGFWQCHSWLIDVDDTIIETTGIPWELYYDLPELPEDRAEETQKFFAGLRDE
jgi:hypothetical protein